MDPVSGASSIIAKLPEYGLLGIITALLMVQTWAIARYLVGIINRYFEAQELRIADARSLEKVVTGVTTALAGLDASVMKRTEMTERITAGQQAQAAAVEHLAVAVEQFTRRLDLSDQAARIRADDIVNRLVNLERMAAAIARGER